MNTTKTFLLGEFPTNSDTPQDVPGFTFTIPANAPAKLRLELLYSAPGDVDALLSLGLDSSSIAYAAYVFDGSHEVTSPPDQQPSVPESATNFTPILPKGLGDIEMPGRGVIFRRNGLFVDYYFIGGNNPTTFTVQLRQREVGSLPSYLHWGFAEFNAK